jgi:hypothetical protein
MEPGQGRAMAEREWWEAEVGEIEWSSALRDLGPDLQTVRLAADVRGARPRFDRSRRPG